ncbi:MAG: gamma-glutamyltransferase family protein [Betaproteobacteria bacterium]|nr:gamma-glutamyltransferase family protein [Betaproteobacteria bacterium]
MTAFDWEFPYLSRRLPLLARNVVATAQPLAAQAGLSMMLRGGNAVDAALATAIALTVVEPVSNGVGSDAFAMVWDGTTLHGLNASGRSPLAWVPGRFAGRRAMPETGWDSVTVPGAVSAWAALSARFGRLPFATLFEPAIAYARQGFPVSPVVAMKWRKQVPLFADQPGFAEAFLPGGRAPAAGETFALPALAQTLDAIADTRGEAFYRGSLAEALVAHAAAHGGALTLADLDAHAVEWVAPIGIDYRGYTLHELPPSGQGIAALIALGILAHHDLAAHPVDSAASLHLQIEAMKLAFADVHRHVADPRAMTAEVTSLLDAEYLAQRAREIDPDRARSPLPGRLSGGGTVYLTAADAEGMMVSYIQSNYGGFGSGVVVPGTGIGLQNRGSGFTLERGHPNEVGPGKRPFHTIIPAFVTRNGVPVMSFGVMGGAMQPQGHVQIMVRLADYRQNPQAACDAPRWRVRDGGAVEFEAGVEAQTVARLVRMGHRVAEGDAGSYFDFGAGQFIYRLADGYFAASDPRRDGQAVGF